LTTRLGLLAILFPLWTASAIFAWELPPLPGKSAEVEANPRFFESKIRPVLAANCVKCHGAKKQRGGLRIDSREGLLRGGESGPALDPGDDENSLLMQAVRHQSLQMPPDGKLSDDEIADLAAWIRRGADWPAETPRITGIVDRREREFTEEDRQYWAFRAPTAPAVPLPVPQEWVHGPIDAFVLRNLTAQQLGPSPRAAPAMLLRRVYFDLVGLPPTASEVAEFVAAPEADALDRTIDRLLASPRYGEKAARIWLDLVRYADSDGFKQDDYRPHAWRYRDYAIEAFNSDKSYRTFVQEQIAGDELAPQDPAAIVATGYLRHWIYEYNQRDVRSQWTHILNDITDVTADVFLGLGISCARCHDHKYDPILQRDYFRLQAFFAAFQPRDRLLISDQAEQADYGRRLSEWEAKTSEIRERMAEIERPHRGKVTAQSIDKFPKDIRPMLWKVESERTPFERQIADLAGRQITLEQVNLKMESKLSDDEKQEWLTLSKRLAEYAQDRPAPPATAFAASDVGAAAPVTLIPGKPELAIAPGFPSLLDPSDAVIEPLPALPSTGRRLALARWLTSDENPLASRVAVNRVWQALFGRGIVATASDFGRLGTPPTDPELLDWLARRFQGAAWRFKPLHRMLLASSTYRQTSQPVAIDQGLRIDPENRWLWRMPVRRLQAEQLRDAMLQTSGELDLAAWGPGVDAERPRRSIYAKILRNRRDPLIDQFDGVDNFTSTSQRNVTTTPMQALLLMNGPFVLARTQQLAQQLGAEPNNDRIVQQLFEQILSRPPVESERTEFERILATNPVRSEAIEDLCHVLLNSSEFIYVE
jgi:cytochrome c553